MDGNCANAQRGFGRNEMYPCFDASVTYGLAVTGLAVNGTTLPVAITTDGAKHEPNVRTGEAPSRLSAHVTVSGLVVGHAYEVFRYDGIGSLPAGPPFDVGYAHKTRFTAAATTHSFDDPNTFASDGAVYYLAVDAAPPTATLAATPPTAPLASPVDSVRRGELPPAIPSVPIAPNVPPLPLVSLGTGSGQHEDVAAATELWLRLGGRAIDTAWLYEKFHKSESGVAAGIAASGVPAHEIFIITKVMCSSFEQVSRMVDDNLRRLQTTPKLTLIHFPGTGHFPCSDGGSVAETWRALEAARAAGKTASIGVSNFGVADLRELKRAAKVWPPAVNQGSMSVGYHDDETISFCGQEGTTYMAYSPLCGGSNGSSCQHGSVMHLPKVQSIAKVHNVSAAQVALKWLVQQGRPLATAVAREDFTREDLDLWSWGNLSVSEMAALEGI